MLKKVLPVIIALLLTALAVYGYYSYNNVKRFKTLKTPNSAIFTGDETDVFVVDIFEQEFEDVCNYTPKQSAEADYQGAVGHANNKIGMYAYDVDSLIYKSAEFANANGGDWGYILIPINISESDSDKMQRVFEKLNRLHLIPILQLWDFKRDTYQQETVELANMLNSLPWPTQTRYISVYNEVNDDAFWPGGRNPNEYADVLEYTIDTFKAENPNYFLMNGAFNTSARSNANYTSTEVFLQQMYTHNPGSLTKLDGWASHPYPQPNFAGNPLKSGRDGIRAYKWELEQLENLGINTGSLPVFITETGWAHREGKVPNFLFVSDKKAAQYLKIAFERFWLPDPSVVAITPFTIIYDAPHDHFSFLKKDGSPYEVYSVIKNMPKTRGKPPLTTEHTQIVGGLAPCTLF